MNNILSAFLTAGLLPIGEDDEKLKLLEAAASELTKQIVEDPLLTYRFALVGFTDQATTNDPALKKAEEALFNKWQTAANKIGSNPVQVYRAVILRAIELAAGKDSAVGYAIGLIAQNEPTLHLPMKEHEAIGEMLGRLQAKADDESSEAWVNPVNVTLPKLSVKARKGITKEQLKNAIARAAGPQDESGTALNTPNPHWPNAGEPWSHAFVGRAADAIYATLQNSKEFVDEIDSALRDAIQGLVSGLERLAIRDAKSELLWIRTSMYSPSGRKGYRNLDASDVLLHAVLDVSRAVAPKAPPSVEFFLRDLVSALGNSNVTLADVLTQIGPKLKELPEAKTIVGDPLPPVGRRSWLDVAVRPDTTSASFEQQTGVSNAHQEDKSEFAVKFYRELQIRKLLSPAT
jgi:hypothetical protein